MKLILSLMTILLPFWSYSQVPSIHRNAEIEAMVQEISSESLENAAD